MSVHMDRRYQARPVSDWPRPSAWRHVWYAVEVVGQAFFLLALMVAILVAGAGLGAVLGIPMGGRP